MNPLKPFLPSLIALMVAFSVSLFLKENAMVRLVSFVVFFVTALVVFERLVSKRGVRWRAYAPAVLFAAITWTHLPLKLVFQSEFERMASAIDEGSMLKTPFWTGPFEIKRVGGDHDSDPPFLATNTGDHDIVGFVMHPK